MQTVTAAKASLRQIQASQDPDLVRRCLGGALAAVCAYAGMGLMSAMLPMVGSSSIQLSQWITVNLPQLLWVAAVASIVVLAARWKPDRRLLKLGGAALVGIFLSALFLWPRDVSSPEYQLLLSDLLQEVGELPQTPPSWLVYPAVWTVGAAIGFSTFVRVLASTAIHEKIWVYTFGIALAGFAVFIVPSIVLLDLRLDGYFLGLGTSLAPECFAVGLATDVGQTVAGSAFVGKHSRKVLVGLAALLVVAVVLGWKPMLAEYHYFRGVLLFSSHPVAAREHLEEAYSLRPRKPPITHAYSSLVLQSKAREAFVHGDPEGAIRLSEEAMGVLPEAPDAYHLAATIHGRMGDHGRAVELCRKAIDVARQTTSEDYRRWGVGIFSPVSFYRQALVSALVEEGSRASVTEVVRYLQDEDLTLVRYVLESLADGQFKESVSAIQELLESTTDEDVRQAATAALGRLNP